MLYGSSLTVSLSLSFLPGAPQELNCYVSLPRGVTAKMLAVSITSGNVKIGIKVGLKQTILYIPGSGPAP